MNVSEFNLFPTRLLTIEVPETAGMNDELCELFRGREEFAAGFNMHPDSLNLLTLADTTPAIARVRDMFLDGLKRWLAAEGVAGPDAVDMVLFSNYAATGELTLAHNHSADVVGIYYARTAAHDRPAVHIPDDATDYFDAGDGVLVLHDPRFNANLSAVGVRDHVKIYPRPGLMLIFPGYLWHSVTPHLGEFRRLSLSMNFTLHWPGGSNAERRPLV